MNPFFLMGRIAVFCLLSYPLFSCPNDLNVSSALQQGDIRQLRFHANQLKDCPNWQDSLGMVFHKLGIAYNSVGKLDSAIFFTDKAVGLRDSLYSTGAHIDLGKSNHNLGVFYKMEGEYLLAKPHFEKAIGIYEQLNERSRIRRSMIELSTMHRFEGDYQKSETLLLFLINDASENEEKSKAKALLNLADAYLHQNKYQDAIIVLEQCINILKHFNNSQDLAGAHLNLGLIYKKLSNYSQSLFYYEKALAIYEDIGDCDGVEMLANNIGNLLLNTSLENQIEEAKAYFELSLEENLSCENQELMAQSYDGLGEVAFTQKKFELSNTLFGKAIHVLVPEIEGQLSLNKSLKSALIKTPHKLDLFVYLSDKSRALKVLYEQSNDKTLLKEAIQYLEVGDYLVDQLRQNHNNQSTKLFWRQEVLPFYEKAIELCALLQDVDKAFFFFEKSKSILLLEALVSSNALQSVPDTLQRKVKHLERQIRLNHNHSQELEGKEKAEKLKLILSLEKKLENLNQSLITQYPPLKTLGDKNQVIDLKTFMSSYIKNNSKTLVHYFYGEENVYVLVLENEKQSVIQLAKSSGVSALVRDYLQYFEQADRIDSHPTEYLQQAKKVYDVLIRPLGLTANKELLIIPAGLLTYLPFEALVTKTSNDFTISNAPYLILHHKTSYGFSATLFDQLEQRPSLFTKSSVLAFAPFANSGSNDYPALNFSQDELSKIKQFITIDLYKNNLAKLKSFIDKQGDYQVLHLSTHAYSSTAESQPFIVFSDTTLNLTELYQYHVPANLVVLSACQTQIGKLAPGEGVLGLSRGFFYAGARSVVSSLWNLNAQSTSVILSSFYEAMSQKVPKHLALNNAKIAYLNNEDIAGFQKSPYYWAGLNYYGDSNEWNVEQANKFWKPLLLLLTFCLGIWLWKMK